MRKIPTSGRDVFIRLNLVDPASSHMLVSKIKPCMSQNKFRRICEWLIKTVIIYLMINRYMDTCGNSRANTCAKSRLLGRDVFIRYRTNPARALG